MAFLWLLLYLVVLYLRPGEWVPFFQQMRLVPLVTAGSLLFLGFQLAISRRTPARLPHTPMLLGLFAAILLSHAVHTYLAGVISAWRAFLPNIILYLLIVNLVTTTRKLQATLWVLAVLSVLLVAQGAHQAATGVGWAGQPYHWQGRITWIGIFEDPNDLALAFVIMVPVLLSLMFKPGFALLKWVPLLLAGVLIYGVYLTNSRGGMLALMVSIACFFIRRSKWVVPGTVFGGTCALLLFMFGPSRLGVLSASEGSAAGRLEAWYYGFQLLKSNPVLGVGKSMFTEDYPLTAHNSFVLAFAELGLVGFFFWVGLLYMAFRGLSLLRRHPNPAIPAYAAGLQASLVGFCAAAFFLSRTYTAMPYLLVALCAALSNIAVREAPECRFAFTGKDARNILWVCVGVLVLLQVAMKTWL